MLGKVYHVAGDDHLDDPAWGEVPVFTGTLDQIAGWLMLSGDLSALAVHYDKPPYALWAGDFLHGHFDAL